MKTAVQMIGLVRGTPGEGQKHRANGRGIFAEMGEERATHSETYDPSRTGMNVYDQEEHSGIDVWDEMDQESREYKMQVRGKTKTGEDVIRERSLRKDAVIGVAIIINPPYEDTKDWTVPEYERFYKDTNDVLAEFCPEIFRIENKKFGVRHLDEGHPEAEGLDEHKHEVFSCIDQDGKYCGNKIDARFLSDFNKFYPQAMRDRGWTQMEDLETTDWDRMKEDPEYQVYRAKKLGGQRLTTNEVLHQAAEKKYESAEEELESAIQANTEAQGLKSEAESMVLDATDQARTIKSNAWDQAKKIVSDAKDQARTIKSEAETETKQLEDDKKGLETEKKTLEGDIRDLEQRKESKLAEFSKIDSEASETLQKASEQADKIIGEAYQVKYHTVNYPSIRAAGQAFDRGEVNRNDIYMIYPDSYNPRVERIVNDAKARIEDPEYFSAMIDLTDPEITEISNIYGLHNDKSDEFWREFSDKVDHSGKYPVFTYQDSHGYWQAEDRVYNAVENGKAVVCATVQEDRVVVPKTVFDKILDCLDRMPIPQAVKDFIDRFKSSDPDRNHNNSWSEPEGRGTM